MGNERQPASRVLYRIYTEDRHDFRDSIIRALKKRKVGFTIVGGLGSDEPNEKESIRIRNIVQSSTW